ncbi:MAG: FG-GAP-like repeat-containing protein, partial [Holophagales bacterium]|nr:FG-GAP-like repeat-containing protein [Holophagales bacterium]
MTTRHPSPYGIPATVLAPVPVAVLVAAVALALSPPAFADAPFGGEQRIEGGLSGVNSIAAGELDGSNGADIFYGAEGPQTLTVALQQAGGTWSTQALTPGSRMRDVGIADLDGDGDGDLFYGDFNGGRVYWRENDLDTSGSFLARVEMASGIGGAQGLHAADLDGDGDLDVAGGSSSGSGKLAWYENVTGDGTTWLGRDIYSSRILAVEAGDLDLDGDQDLLVQDINADDILWWENTGGDGTAWTRRTISSFPAARKGLQAVDLDFDGDLDVVGDPNGDWWENIDKASSWTRRSYSGSTDINDTDVLDLDGDGDRDIVAARNLSGQVSWWPNLTCSPADGDSDADGVRDGCDVCDGFD